jgi:flagellin-like hook-associated protein FlgL
MSELKGYATQDPLKSETDVASYNNEFKDLQQQLHDISQMTFNGQSLFADTATGGGKAYFGGASQEASQANQISIHTSAQGSNGTKVLIHRSLLLSGLTIKNGTGSIASGSSAEWSTANSSSSTGRDDYITLAKDSDSNLLNIADVSSAAFESAISNIVFLRAQAGAGMSRLQFSADSIATQETNMKSALGRIEDVDIAMESANLAKYSILMQASAAMVAQANVSNDVALMLLR